MSASTVSVTANQGPTTRRRAVDKNLPSGGTDLAAAAAIIADSENRDTRITSGDNAAVTSRDARKTPSQIHARKGGSVKKSSKPRWLTAVSILTKNLALIVVLLGFVQMVRWTVWNSDRDIGDLSIMSGSFEGKLSEVERLVAKTIKAMQVQVNAIDHKLEDGISSVRKEFDEKLEKKGEEVDLKLRALDVRSDAFEKFMDGFDIKSLLSKEEFSQFFEEFKKSRKDGGGDSADVSVDDIMDYARQIVLKEIERHAADGLGMVDYALATAGARVLRHSEPYRGNAGGVGFALININRGGVEPERMLRPSFGEPGQCFPLKGGSGFVEIKLRTAIVAEAVTLEHVDKSVAFDRSSAPKHCMVSGWLQTDPDSTTEAKMFHLTEFTYDLDKSNAQTYKVEFAPSNLVNTIRFDFTSNHGSASHTCIYRLRVHGHEPSPIPALELQS